MNIIVATEKNWGIGKDNDLLFHYKEDMDVFKQLTMYNLVIMGKNTLLSLPKQMPLKNRLNLVLTTDEELKNQYKDIQDIMFVKSIPELFLVLDDLIKNTNLTEDKIWCIGGGSIYKQLLHYCKYAYVNRCDKEYEADTFFPNLNDNEDWRCDRIQICKTAPLTYLIYENTKVKER